MIARFLFLALYLILLPSQYSEIIRVSRYRFDVKAFNEWGREIKTFRGRGRLEGSKVFLSFRAFGYRPTHTMVALKEGQTLYPVRIEMKDPFFEILLKNRRGEIIESHMEPLSEFIAPGEFSFEVEIRDWQYSDFTPWDVEIRIDRRKLERAFVALRGYGYGRIIEINFPRDNLKEYSNEIEIKIPRDKQVSQSLLRKKKQLRFHLQNHILLPGMNLEAMKLELQRELERKSTTDSSR